MLSTEKEQADFCTEFNISGEKFRNSRLTWMELEQIAEDVERRRNEHQNTVKQYAEVLQKCLVVHSLSYRVKDTKHLMAYSHPSHKNFIQPLFLSFFDAFFDDGFAMMVTT